MKPNTAVRFTVSLPWDLADYVDGAAADRHIPRSQFIALAVKAFYEAELDKEVIRGLTEDMEAERNAAGALSWAELLDEARAFEAWYAPTRMTVNAWVGVDTPAGFYGGWSVDGDQLWDEWDESVMTTASGKTPEEVIADLIRIARAYRERIDAERAEFAADDAAAGALS
jgi:hypothetical protein